MSRIYIYDPRLNIQEETTVEEVMGFTGYTRKTILFVSNNQRRLSATGCYLSRDKLTAEQRRQLHAKEQFPGERWRPVCDHETRYEVSDHGRVRLRRQEGEEMTIKVPYFRKKENGTFVKLGSGKQAAHVRVARIVYEAFHGRQQRLKIIHKNKIGYENMLENLIAVPNRIASQHYSQNTKKSNRTPIYKIDRETLEILDEYVSLKEASKENFTCQRVIRETCRGKRPDAFGNIFCYVSDYERLCRERLAVPQPV